MGISLVLVLGVENCLFLKGCLLVRLGWELELVVFLVFVIVWKGYCKGDSLLYWVLFNVCKGDRFNCCLLLFW